MLTTLLLAGSICMAVFAIHRAAVIMRDLLVQVRLFLDRDAERPPTYVPHCPLCCPNLTSIHDHLEDS